MDVQDHKLLVRRREGLGEVLMGQERRREVEGRRRMRGCSLLLSFVASVLGDTVAAVADAVGRKRGKVAGTAAVAGRREVGRKELAEEGREDWGRRLLLEGSAVLCIRLVVDCRLIPGLGHPKTEAEELPKLVEEAASPCPRERPRLRWRGWIEVVG